MDWDVKNQIKQIKTEYIRLNGLKTAVSAHKEMVLVTSRPRCEIFFFFLGGGVYEPGNAQISLLCCRDLLEY